MNYIIKTIITNNAGPRKLHYIGAKGIFCDKSIVVEGAYPWSCENSAKYQCMLHELKNNKVSVQLLTDIPCQKIIPDLEGSVSLPNCTGMDDKVIPAPEPKLPDGPCPVAPLEVVEEKTAQTLVPNVNPIMPKDSTPIISDKVIAVGVKPQDLGNKIIAEKSIDEAMGSASLIGAAPILPSEKGNVAIFTSEPAVKQLEKQGSNKAVPELKLDKKVVTVINKITQAVSTISETSDKVTRRRAPGTRSKTKQ
jgi:hypothetical protein